MPEFDRLSYLSYWKSGFVSYIVPVLQSSQLAACRKRVNRTQMTLMTQIFADFFSGLIRVYPFNPYDPRPIP
jgi:hypothetical protein